MNSFQSCFVDTTWAKPRAPERPRAPVNPFDAIARTSGGARGPPDGRLVICRIAPAGTIAATRRCERHAVFASSTATGERSRSGGHMPVEPVMSNPIVVIRVEALPARSDIDAAQEGIDQLATGAPCFGERESCRGDRTAGWMIVFRFVSSKSTCATNALHHAHALAYDFRTAEDARAGGRASRRGQRGVGRLVLVRLVTQSQCRRAVGPARRRRSSRLDAGDNFARMGAGVASSVAALWFGS